MMKKKKKSFFYAQTKTHNINIFPLERSECEISIENEHIKIDLKAPVCMG